MTLESVKTLPCQHCGSDDTIAQLLGDELLGRVCQSCGWLWDACEVWQEAAALNGGQLLTANQRVRLLETGKWPL